MATKVVFLCCIFVVESKNGTDYYHYTYTDHLGSIVATCNQYGTKETEQNFDAWGRKRNPTTWSYSNVPNAPVWLYRGYTGHEGLKNFRLINMNGRMYDPVVGRMLSVDNYIQAGGYTQSYNRYSYAFNNPLKYDDPDGEWVNILAGAVIGGLVNAGGQIIGNLKNNRGAFDDWNWGSFAGSIVAGAVGGVVGPALQTAQIGGFYGGAILGASTGFTQSYVGGLVNGDLNGKSLLKSTFIGAGAGGLVSGFDAMLFKGSRFLDGKSRNLVKKTYQMGRGDIRHEDYYHDSKKLAQLNEVTGDGFRKSHKSYDVEINGNFEGDLTIEGYANPADGETFYFESNDFSFSTTEKGIPFNGTTSSSGRIKWGIRGTRVHPRISNQMKATNPEIFIGGIRVSVPPIEVTAVVKNSTVNITGNWRQFNNFLWYK